MDRLLCERVNAGCSVRIATARGRLLFPVVGGKPHKYVVGGNRRRPDMRAQGAAMKNRKGGWYKSFS